LQEDKAFNHEKIPWENMKIDTWFWLTLPKEKRPDYGMDNTAATDVTMDATDTSTDVDTDTEQTETPSITSPSSTTTDGPIIVKTSISTKSSFSNKPIERRYFFPFMFDMDNDEHSKHAFQLVTEHDIYTFRFESDTKKWDCMQSIWRILEEVKQADPTVTKCYAVMKDYTEDVLENSIVQQKKQKRKQKTVITASDLPKFSSKKKEAEMEKLVDQGRIDRVKNLDENTCMSVCVATATFQQANPGKFQINFFKGDIFFVYEKIKKGKKWWLVRKCGLNNAIERYKQLTSNKLPSTYHELRQLQIEQQRKAKRLVPRPAQLKPVTHHYVKVNKITDDELKELADKLDMEKLLQGEPTPNGAKTPTATSPENKRATGRKSIFMKDTKSLLELTNEDEIKFFKSIINVYNDTNETGIVPCDFLQEMNHDLTQKIIKLVERRNEMEVRKVRNFMVKKKDTTPTGFSPSVTKNSPAKSSPVLSRSNTTAEKLPSPLNRSNTVVASPLVVTPTPVEQPVDIPVASPEQKKTPTAVTRSISLFAKRVK
jgi:hypothetical protein